MTQGSSPRLHVGYESSKIKRYFKEDHALRTETTINNTYDFGLGGSLENPPELRTIGFDADCRRFLKVGTSG